MDEPGELAQYIGDEEKAEEVLCEIGILKRYTTCQFCGEDHIGKSPLFESIWDESIVTSEPVGVDQTAKTRLSEWYVME